GVSEVVIGSDREGERLGMIGCSKAAMGGVARSNSSEWRQSRRVEKLRAAAGGALDARDC
ncbi:hypothetical protein U1Q18_002319, partial [Sarracenia purpurea var. burkii]